MIHPLAIIIMLVAIVIVELFMDLLDFHYMVDVVTAATTRKSIAYPIFPLVSIQIKNLVVLVDASFLKYDDWLM